MITQLDKDTESVSDTSNDKHATYKSNIDPIAVLKRVEDLRKWQEEEKMKLLKAHEDQMQQFRMEQERLTKHISNEQQIPVPIRQTSFQHKLPKYGNYEDTYTEAGDLLSLGNANKELQTSTDSGYTNSEGQFTTSNSSELTILTKKYQKQQPNQNQNITNKPNYSNCSHYNSSNDDDVDSSDSSLNEQDMKLVKLITNQIRMKKINLEAFIDDDYDNDEELKAFEKSESYEELVFKKRQQECETENSGEESRGSEEFAEDNERLSTILEVSCESESPLKMKYSKRFSGIRNFKKDLVQEETVPEEAEPVGVIVAEAVVSNGVFDVDSIPIGNKVTNKMSFEELLEESLKKQDQLDYEQQQLKKNKKPLAVKKPFLQRGGGTNKTESVVVPVQKPPPHAVQKSIASKSGVSTEITSEVVEVQKNTGAPRPFLKRGEGLKRFQPDRLTAKTSTGQVRNQSNITPINNHQQQQKSIKKSESLTNMNCGTTANQAKRTLSSKSLQSKSTTNLKINNSNEHSITSKLSKQYAEITSMTNKNLKQATQDRTTTMPLQGSLNEKIISKQEPASCLGSSSDDELKEFEHLEQYVDEHPSFRSNVSFVENVLSNYSNDKSNNNITNANKFAYMLNLLNSNNSKKLAHLLEEELNEINQKNTDNFISQSNHNNNNNNNNNNKSNISEEGLKDKDLEAERKAAESDEEVNLTCSSPAQRRSSSRCSDLSIEDSYATNRRSQSTGSTSHESTSSRIMSRKVKRISNEQEASEINALKYASETNLILKKKKYSCLYYENDCEDETDAQQIGREFSGDQFEKENSHSVNGLNVANKNSQAYSQDNLCAKEAEKKRFDDRVSWQDEDENNELLVERRESDFQVSRQSHQGDKTPVVTQLMGKLFPSLKQHNQKQLIQQQQQQQQEQCQQDRDAFERLKQRTSHTVVSNNNSLNGGTQSENMNASLLKQKLTQLEAEIEKFQKKNVELAKLKEKCESELKSAEWQRKLFEKTKEEELTRMRDMHDEEMKKLRLEKKIFEQYKQSLKDSHDRRERDEFEKLKRQLNDVVEEVKLKETRWMANNNRLKERIESLEEEKRELKRELQLVEMHRIDTLISQSNNQNIHSNNATTSTTTTSAKRMSNNLKTSDSSCSVLPVKTCLATATQNSDTESAVSIDKSLNQFQVSSSSANSTKLCQNSNPSLFNLKRSTSEKSLHSSSSSSSSSTSSASSTSSSCSSSSSASIGSTGSSSSSSQLPFSDKISLKTNYLNQFQEKSPLLQNQQQHLANQMSHQLQQTHLQDQHQQYQHLKQQYQAQEPITLNYGPTSLADQPSQLSNRFSPSPLSSQQTNQQHQQSLSKTVKFKLDIQQPVPHNTPPPIQYSNNTFEYENTYTNNEQISNVSGNNSQNTSCNTSNSAEEYVTTQSYGNERKLRVKETRRFDDKHLEKYLEDGTTLTIFPNGTVKEVSADKRCTFVKFFNGDRKEMNHDTGTETYFYAETNITQIIYSNGMQILKFPSGQIEKHHINKTREIIFPDKICKLIYPDGSEESRLPNGTCIKVDKVGGKVIEYPNKQREIHTKDYKRREYPDGSIKTVYTNGISETRYANGRVRVKDVMGNIISDKKA